MKNENTEKHYTKQPDSCLGCTVFFISFVISCSISGFLGSWTGIIIIPLFLFIGNKIVKKIQAKEKNESVKKEQAAEHQEIALQEEKIESNKITSEDKYDNLQENVLRDLKNVHPPKIKNYMRFFAFSYVILCIGFIIYVFWINHQQKLYLKKISTSIKHESTETFDINKISKSNNDYIKKIAISLRNEKYENKLNFLSAEGREAVFGIIKNSDEEYKQDFIRRMTLASYYENRLGISYDEAFDSLDAFNEQYFNEKLDIKTAYQRLNEQLNAEYFAQKKIMNSENEKYIKVLLPIGVFLSIPLVIILGVFFIKSFQYCMILTRKIYFSYHLLSKTQMIFMLFSILSLILLEIVMAGEYDFSYVFLRIIVSISMIGFLLDKFPIWYKFLISINLILYNPIIQIHLDDEDDWMIFNWITFILIMLSIIIISVKVVKNKKVNSLNQ